MQRSVELDSHSPMAVVHMELQWFSGDALLDRRAGKAQISCLHGEWSAVKSHDVRAPSHHLRSTTRW